MLDEPTFKGLEARIKASRERGGTETVSIGVGLLEELIEVAREAVSERARLARNTADLRATYGKPKD